MSGTEIVRRLRTTFLLIINGLDMLPALVLLAISHCYLPAYWLQYDPGKVSCWSLLPISTMSPVWQQRGAFGHPFPTGPRPQFWLCCLLPFQWHLHITVTTIRNSAVKPTTAASHSGLCAMVSMTAGTTVMNKAVVRGVGGRGMDKSKCPVHLL